MRVDVVTIFPGWFDPLDLSLASRARRDGLLDLRVHNLREWATDRHRTVDDSPYGGGAGMVMRPEPWGDALDAVLGDGPDEGPEDGLLVVPTPAGTVFDQATAHELAREPRLVFACGRYEGIDERVLEHARTRVRVRELSLGDYVLGGGEVAALVVIEAVLRLLPGFVGNPASLDEESHESGLLEYPVYTRPATWRGLDVPEVLRGGDHEAVAAWRHEQALRRTARRRPDLLHPSASVRAGSGDAVVRTATPGDAGELLTLQRACWVQEAQANPGVEVPALRESLEDVHAWLRHWHAVVVRAHDRLVAAVRFRREGAAWDIGRIMVAPDLQGRGLGRWLLEYAEAAAPGDVEELRLFTGAGSARNLRMYRRAGYRISTRPVPGAVHLTKRPTG